MKHHQLLLAIITVITGLLIGWLVADYRSADRLANDPIVRGYQLPGHDDDVLEGVMFSPTNELASRSPEWQQQKIQRIDGIAADLSITLDQHLYEVLKPAIDQFAEEKNLSIYVEKGTCGVSSSSLQDKQVNMAGFCCPPATEDRLPGLKYITLGIGAVAILVNSNNPLDDLPAHSIRQAYRGHVTKWSELADGLPDKYIFPITRLHCTRRPAHWKTILPEAEAFHPGTVEADNITNMLNTIADHEYTLGYESLIMIQREQVDSKVKPLLVDGIHPGDLEQLAQGHYPFYRVYNLAVWSDHNQSDAADKLSNYLQNAFQTLDQSTGMVSSQQLKQHGWAFTDRELIGAPKPKS